LNSSTQYTFDQDCETQQQYHYLSPVKGSKGSAVRMIYAAMIATEIMAICNLVSIGRFQTSTHCTEVAPYLQGTQRSPERKPTLSPPHVHFVVPGNCHRVIDCAT